MLGASGILSARHEDAARAGFFPSALRRGGGGAPGSEYFRLETRATRE